MPLLVIVAVATAIGLVGLAVVSAQTTGPTRSFSAAAVPAGGQFEVTVSGINGFGQVVETLPAGFSYVGGSVSTTQGLVALESKQGQVLTFSTGGANSITYSVAAPSIQGGIHSFSGTWATLGGSAVTIGGSRDISVGPSAGVTPSPSPSPSPVTGPTRSFSPTPATLGGGVVVTISGISGFGQVVETLPAGFSYVDRSAAVSPAQALVALESKQGQVLTFSTGGASSITYRVTAPGTAGTHAFSGTWTALGGSAVTIRGAAITVGTVVTPVPPPPPPPPSGPIIINQRPSFDDGDSATRSVAEYSDAGTNVGEPVTATDPEGSALAYALGGADAGLFEIDSSTGQITVGDGTTLDFKTTESYSVRVDVRDPSAGRDAIAVTISVTDVNEPGMLSISSTEAAFGTELTATLTDPDGGITDVSWEWQWSSDGDTWFSVPGGMDASYTPSHGDGGLMLRATVEYSDAAGSASLESEATQALPMAPTPTPVPPAPTATPVPPAPTATPVPPAPTATPVPPAPTATPVPPAPTATPVPPAPTATPVPPAPTATPVPPAPTATPVPPEEEGGFPGWLIIVIVIGVAAIAAAGVLIVRNRQQQ